MTGNLRADIEALCETAEKDGRYYGREYGGITTAQVRAILAAHPAEEAQVEALTLLITEATDSGPDLADIGNPHQYDAGIARRLIATGRIEVSS